MVSVVIEFDNCYSCTCKGDAPSGFTFRVELANPFSAAADTRQAIGPADFFKLSDTSFFGSEVFHVLEGRFLLGYSCGLM